MQTYTWHPGGKSSLMFHRNSTYFQQSEGREYRNYFNCFFVWYIKNFSSRIITHAPVLTLSCRSASPSGQHHSPISSRHHSSSSQSGSSVQRHSPSPHRKRTPSPSYQRTASPPARRSSSPYPPHSSPPQRKRSPSRHRSPGRDKGRHDRDRTSQSHDRRHERRDGRNENSTSESFLFVCKLHFET